MQAVIEGFAKEDMPTYTVVFDGGSKGNPGLGYGSYKLFDAGGEFAHAELSYAARGNRVTNNEAEYLTLIAALRRLSEVLGDRSRTSRVDVLGDSMLVISQLRGDWKVRKAELRPFYQEALALLAVFGAHDLKWHDRTNSVEILGH